jgi:hypothetical protein
MALYHAVCSLLHYAVGSPRLAVSQHRALWRADFPQPPVGGRNHVAYLGMFIICSRETL